MMLCCGIALLDVVLLLLFGAFGLLLLVVVVAASSTIIIIVIKHRWRSVVFTNLLRLVILTRFSINKPLIV
jgi:hypothetical protein